MCPLYWCIITSYNFQWQCEDVVFCCCVLMHSVGHCWPDYDVIFTIERHIEKKLKKIEIVIASS